jgi:hypothetical protein
LAGANFKKGATATGGGRRGRPKNGRDVIEINLNLTNNLAKTAIQAAANSQQQASAKENLKQRSNNSRPKFCAHPTHP